MIEHANNKKSNNKKSNNQISNNNLISMETELDFIMRDIFTINRKIPKYEEKKELLKETSDKLNELSELYKKMLPLQSSLIRQAGNKLFIKNVQNKLKPLYSDKDKLIKNILRNKVIIRRIDERLYKYNDADYNPDVKYYTIIQKILFLNKIIVFFYHYMFTITCLLIFIN